MANTKVVRSELVLRIQKIKAPLENGRVKLHDSLNKVLEAYKPKENAIRAKIKACEPQIFAIDMLLSAAMEAAGLKDPDASKAALAVITKKVEALENGSV